MQRLTSVLLIALHLGGCYRYVPHAEPMLPTGSEVAVTIGEAGSAQLADLLGPGARGIHGHVVESNDSSFTVAVRTVQYDGSAAPVSWSGQHVTLHRSFIRSVQVRTLSRKRSVVAAAILAAAALAASLLVVSGFGGEDGGDRLPPGPPIEH